MNYYNEFDPKAAAWLRELIKAGEIPPGFVDERSITEIQPHELAQYTQCHFFAGIGGWSFALQLAGWPATRPVGTGSCPCQPFSLAGSGKGNDDSRHLWPAFFSLIARCRALGQQWAFAIFGEQVESAIAHGWLDSVSADLEGEGYACGAAILGAHSVGAPHRRQRLYWVAYANRERRAGEHALLRQDESGRIAGAVPETSRRSSNCSLDHPNSSRLNGSESGAEGTSRHETRLRLPCDGQPNCAMADPDGGITGNRSLQRSGQHGQQSEDSGAGPVGSPTGVGPEIRARLHGEHDGQITPNGRILGGVEHAESDGWEQWWTESGGRGAVCGRASGVAQGDTDDSRSQGRGLQSGYNAGSWSTWSADVDFIACTDGKKRLIKSGIFPLAHGFPSRVGLLRGSGNAIVPQAAAQFVMAAEEARLEVSP